NFKMSDLPALIKKLYFNADGLNRQEIKKKLKNLKNLLKTSNNIQKSDFFDYIKSFIFEKSKTTKNNDIFISLNLASAIANKDIDFDRNMLKCSILNCYNNNIKSSTLKYIKKHAKHYRLMTFNILKPQISEQIEKNLIRKNFDANAIDNKKSVSIIETNLNLLSALFPKCFTRKNILNELKSQQIDYKVVFEIGVRHSNRFVRESVLNLVSAVCSSCFVDDQNASPEFSEILGFLGLKNGVIYVGLRDNWSQVRYKASIAARNFSDLFCWDQKIFKALL
ncbi:hypothetical protein MHBO_002775, partial [Bonamia ostreae]